MSSFFYCTGRSAHAKRSRLQTKIAALGMPLKRVFEDETSSLLINISQHERDHPLLQIDTATSFFCQIVPPR